eukprot:4970632-Heterocapsa_arctica.AAC.1
MDSLLAENVRATRKDWDEYGLGHIEFEIRHDGIFAKSREDIIGRLVKIRNNQGSIIRESSEKRMAFGVGEDEFPMEPAQE